MIGKCPFDSISILILRKSIATNLIFFFDHVIYQFYIFGFLFMVSNHLLPFHKIILIFLSLLLFLQNLFLNISAGISNHKGWLNDKDTRN